MKKINEIFYSLQGEGHHAGTPAVFIRFSGCNLRCPFCDTMHQDGKMMSDEEIAGEAVKYPAEWIILTGGEPTLQLDKKLLDTLKKTGKKIAMETNGTRPVPKGVDFVTLSPKFQFCDNAELKVTECDELKVVFSGCDDISVYDAIKARHRFLQPCDTGDAERNQNINTEAVLYCKNHPEWRLSLQQQKILDIR